MPAGFNLKDRITIGSRGSELALWQAEFVRTALQNIQPSLEVEIKLIKTTGDRILDRSLAKIGDKGLFTKEIENALLDGSIDLAVHSLKDLPTTQPAGLLIAAVTAREAPNDVLIARSARSIADLPPGARVATGSLRRRSQLLSIRPDLDVSDIRGNVPTRIEKFLSSELDATLLAFAGVHRLGLDQHISSVIGFDEMLPAVGQGALGLETRADDEGTIAIARLLNDAESEAATAAERSFLRSLEGGCQVPIAALAAVDRNDIVLRGYVGSLDGSVAIRETTSGPRDNAAAVGERLAARCMELGAAGILQEARQANEHDHGKVHE